MAGPFDLSKSHLCAFNFRIECFTPSKVQLFLSTQKRQRVKQGGAPKFMNKQTCQLDEGFNQIFQNPVKTNE